MAAALKWPVAIRAFQAVVEPHLLPCGSQPVVQPPEVILAAGIMEAVRACNGDAMKEMHHELTRKVGRASVHSGLIWVLRRLGFIHDDDDDDDTDVGVVKKRPAGAVTPSRLTHKRIRGRMRSRRQDGQRADAAPSQDQDQLECQLGATQQTFHVICGQQQLGVLKTLLHEAGQVRLPASEGTLSQQQLREYGDSVTQAVQKAFRCSGGYCCKTVGRKVIAFAHPLLREDVRLPASLDRGVWDNLPMETMMQWLPDVNEHMRPLQALSGREVRMMFALPPLWVSMFACYLSCADKSIQEKSMRCPLARVLPDLELLMSKMEVMPSPITLMQYIFRQEGGSGPVRRAASGQIDGVGGGGHA